jgi:hypothetical protein
VRVFPQHPAWNPNLFTGAARPRPVTQPFRAPKPLPAQIGYAGSNPLASVLQMFDARVGNVQGAMTSSEEPFQIRFMMDLFKGSKEQALSHKALRHLLECLTRIDEDYLRAHPETPSIYASGVRYQEEPLGVEEWMDIPTILDRKVADCEDLSCWRTAELRVREGKPSARSTFSWKVRPDGGYLYHIVTQHPNGVIEDPSRVLGMK